MSTHFAKATGEERPTIATARSDASPAPPVQLVSLMSAPFSGATLLSILLDKHAQVVCDGEAFPVNCAGRRTRCSCGADQIQCPYYRSVAAHMLDQAGAAFNPALFAFVPVYGRHYYLNRVFDGYWINSLMSFLQHTACRLVPTLRRTERAFVDAQEQFFRNALHVRDGTVLVDGTKSFRRAEILANSRRFMQKALHLVRDGRGFCLSYVRNKRLERSSLAHAAEFWMQALRKVDAFRNRYPEIDVLQVRYEDLSQDPPKTLRSVCEFLSLPNDAAMEEAAPSEHHVIGNRMRFSFDGQISERRSWRSELSDSELSVIERIMKYGLKRFGYV